jgi:serine/threonine-protein kinase
MPRDLLPLVRETLGDRYSIEKEIGHGGAARVYLARTPEGAPVALKVLRPELAVTVTAERFLREIRLVRQLDHPNIAGLLDAGEVDWLVYFVMPFIEGPSLKHYLERYRRLSAEDAMRLAQDLLSALAHAHDRGIVHRDVKPENIMLAPTGAVLVDFGIARAIALSGSDRLTRSGITVGTSTYMSPEQILGVQDLDHRTDLYSAACVLFECLAGQPPFHHPNETLVLQHHMTHPPPNLRDLVPEAPPGYVAAVLGALGKQREHRWASAREMLDALTGGEGEAA